MECDIIESDMVNKIFIAYRKRIYNMLKLIQEIRMNDYNVDTYGDFREEDIYIELSDKYNEISRIKIDKNPCNLDYPGRYVGQLTYNVIIFNLIEEMIEVDNKYIY
jgi:hypothetical protein